MKTYTTAQAARILKVDVSRIQQLCRECRLGQTLPQFGNAWQITQAEIDQYLAAGPRKSGRPPKSG